MAIELLDLRLSLSQNNAFVRDKRSLNMENAAKMSPLKWCTWSALAGGFYQSNTNHIMVGAKVPGGTLPKASHCLCRCVSSHSASWCHMSSSKVMHTHPAIHSHQRRNKGKCNSSEQAAIFYHCTLELWWSMLLFNSFWSHFLWLGRSLHNWILIRLVNVCRNHCLRCAVIAPPTALLQSLQDKFRTSSIQQWQQWLKRLKLAKNLFDDWEGLKQHPLQQV